MATTQIHRSEPFPDLADEVLFPRLSDAKLAWLSKRGERRTFEPGEVIYEHAVRDAPFCVIESSSHLSWPLSDREPHLLETVRPGAGRLIRSRRARTNEHAGAAAVSCKHTVPGRRQHLGGEWARCRERGRTLL